MVDVIELLKASLGPSVAALGVAVAFAQWHTNKVKLRLDSYDRRLRVYFSTIAMLDSALSEIQKRKVPAARASNTLPEKPYQGLAAEVAKEFESSLLEAEFLFDEHVSRFMRRIDRDVQTVREHADRLAGHTRTTARGDADILSFRELKRTEERISESRARAADQFRRHLKLRQT